MKLVILLTNPLLADTSTPILEITEQNRESINFGIWMVEFYSAKLPEQSLNDFTQISNLHSNLFAAKINYASINCEITSQLCSKYTITNLPTISMLLSGIKKQDFFPDLINPNLKDMELAFSNLKDFKIKNEEELIIEEQLAFDTNLEDIKSKGKIFDFNKDYYSKDHSLLISKIPPGIWILKYHSPSCSHCIAFKPIYERLANEFKGKVGFLELNCDEFPAICFKNVPQGVPYVEAFENSKSIRTIVGGQTLRIFEDCLRTLIPASIELISFNQFVSKVNDNSPFLFVLLSNSKNLISFINKTSTALKGEKRNSKVYYLTSTEFNNVQKLTQLYLKIDLDYFISYRGQNNYFELANSNNYTALFDNSNAMDGISHVSKHHLIIYPKEDKTDWFQHSLKWPSILIINQPKEQIEKWHTKAFYYNSMQGNINLIGLVPYFIMLTKEEFNLYYTSIGLPQLVPDKELVVLLDRRLSKYYQLINNDIINLTNVERALINIAHGSLFHYGVFISKYHHIRSTGYKFESTPWVGFNSNYFWIGLVAFWLLLALYYKRKK